MLKNLCSYSVLNIVSHRDYFSALAVSKIGLLLAWLCMVSPGPELAHCEPLTHVR